MSRNTATHLRLINGWIPYIWLSSVHCLQLEILQARAPSNFCKWLVSWKGLWGGLQLAYVLSPTSFQTLKWKFSTFGPVCNPGALPGWKEREISSEFSPSNPGWCADGKGQAGSHPVPIVHPISIGSISSDCNFHLTQVWQSFPGRGRCKTLQVEVTVPVTEKVGLWLGLCFFSGTWTIHTLLDTYEGRKLDFLRLQMYQQGCTAEN